MSWNIEGFYVENCSCDAICPCTWSNLTKAATYDDCRAALAFRVERGDVDGVDVGGRTVVLALQTPKMMIDGNWKAGLLFDQDTSDAQMEALTKVMTGAIGGPMAGLAPLIGEVLGAERASIALESGADGWSLTVGDDTSLSGSTMVGPETSEPVALEGITAHPAGPTLTVTPSGEMHSAMFGIEFGGSDRSGFTAPFAWAA